MHVITGYYFLDKMNNLMFPIFYFDFRFIKKAKQIFKTSVEKYLDDLQYDGKLKFQSNARGKVQSSKLKIKSACDNHQNVQIK